MGSCFQHPHYVSDCPSCCTGNPLPQTDAEDFVISLRAQGFSATCGTGPNAHRVVVRGVGERHRGLLAHLARGAVRGSTTVARLGNYFIIEFPE